MALSEEEKLHTYWRRPWVRLALLVLIFSLALIVYVLVNLLRPAPPPSPPFPTPSPTPSPTPEEPVAPQAYPTVVPILYARDDAAVTDYGRLYPEYGPVGLWLRVRWKDVHKNWSTQPNAFDWSFIDRALERAGSQRVTLPDGTVIPRPVILAVSIYSQYGARPDRYITHTPDYLRRAIGDLSVGDPEQCISQPAPPYHDPTYQKELFAFIRALGKRYGEHPLITAVAVGPGYDEETAAIRLGIWCGDRLYSDYLYELIGGPQVYADFVQRTMKVYREAFPRLPLYLQAGNAEWPHRGQFLRFAASLTPPMGYKPNAIAATSGAAFGWKSTLKGNGWMQLAEMYQDRIPIAFEPKVIPAYFGNDLQAQEELYWMLLWGLSHNADFFALQSSLTNPAVDWFHLLPTLDKPPHNWGGFVNFVNRNLGQTPQTSPEVWIVLRDIEPSEDPYGLNAWGQPRNGYVGGEPGDWDHWLYRIPVVDDATTAVLRADLPATPRAAQARQLRRTDGRFMWFQVDDRWQFFRRPPKAEGGDGVYRISVWYLDVGTDAWALAYTRSGGDVVTLRVQKQNTGTMRRVSWIVEDAYFGHLWEGADLRIDDLNDGDEYIHMVHIQALSPAFTSMASGASYREAYSLGSSPAMDDRSMSSSSSSSSSVSSASAPSASGGA